MSVLSNKRTFTLQNLKKLTFYKMGLMCLFLAMIVPFFLFKAAPPQAGFYSELTSTFILSLFILCISFTSSKQKVNALSIATCKVTVFFLTVSAYLTFDLFINPPIYPSLNLLYIGTFILAALLSNTIMAITQNFNKTTLKDDILILVCYGLMSGALIQDVVVILQTLHTNEFAGWIDHVDKGSAYTGNIGQRNLLALYLTLGLLATNYLVQVQKLTTIKGWVIIGFQALILGLINSRSLILYLSFMLIILIIATLWQRQLPKALIKRLTITIVLILLFQFISLPLLKIINPELLMYSSIERIADQGMRIRLTEWYKAWLIFLDRPWFGSGWNSYAYQAFVKTSDPSFPYTPPSYVLFTHSHNLILNLLVELGIVGTSLILGGMTWLLKPLLTKVWQPETLVLLLMLTVFVIHNLVEFSLWYADYFLVFVILLTLLLSTLEQTGTKIGVSQNFKNQRLMVTLRPLLAIVFFVLSVNLYINYYKLDQLYYERINDDSNQQRIETAQRMLNISNSQPLLNAYADLKAAKYLEWMSMDTVPDHFSISLTRSAHYQPFPMQSINYLAQQCHDGNWSKEQWLYYKHLKGYYPQMIPNFSKIMSVNKECATVRDIIYLDCQKTVVEQEKPNGRCVARNIKKPVIKSIDE